MKIHPIKQCRAWRAGEARVQAVPPRAGGKSIDFTSVELVRSWPTTSLETAPVFSLLFSPLFPLPTPPAQSHLSRWRKPGGHEKTWNSQFLRYPPRSQRRKFLVERMLRLISISGAPGNTEGSMGMAGPTGTDVSEAKQSPTFKWRKATERVSM